MREGTDSKAVAAETLAAFDEWVTEAAVVLPIESADVRRAGTLVRRFDLKLLTPDAIHLAICERYRSSLVTLDNRLTAAADVLGIERVSRTS